MSRSTDVKKTANIALTAHDVSRLISEPTPLARIDVLQKISDNYNTGLLEGGERAVAEQIFRILLRDTERQVRRVLAESLKDNPNVPRDVVITLSRDEADEVALPMIQFSQVLTEQDVLDIIRGTENMTRRVAVAGRKHVTTRVTAALLDVQEPGIITQLLQNPGADISESQLGRVLREYSGSEDVLSAMVSRAGLPMTVVEKLVTMVSHNLAESLQKKYQFKADLLTQETDQSREQATLQLLAKTTEANEVDALVNQLHAFHRLTPSIIIMALCRGNLRFFESALARLSSIPVSNARALINDKGDLGFRAIYAKANLPEAFFYAIKLVVQIVRDSEDEGITPATPAYANRLIERILFLAEGKEIDNLSYILAIIRQGIAAHQAA